MQDQRWEGSATTCPICHRPLDLVAAGWYCYPHDNLLDIETLQPKGAPKLTNVREVVQRLGIEDKTHLVDDIALRLLLRERNSKEREEILRLVPLRGEEIMRGYGMTEYAAMESLSLDADGAVRASKLEPSEILTIRNRSIEEWRRKVRHRKMRFASFYVLGFSALPILAYFFQAWGIIAAYVVFWVLELIVKGMSFGNYRGLRLKAWAR